MNVAAEGRVLHCCLVSVIHISNRGSTKPSVTVLCIEGAGENGATEVFGHVLLPLFPLLTMDRVVSSFLQSVFIAAATVGLVVSPVQAQQGSDVTGAVPQSDVSGALTQGDVSAVQSDAVQSRMSNAAEVLVQSMQEGTLEVDGTDQRFSVPPVVATLLTTGDDQSVEQTQHRVVRLLTVEGLPDTEAERLVQVTSGLLADRDVAPDQFQRALRAFNAAVDAAPGSFFDQPPQEFVVVHAVLSTLLRAASA